MSSGNVKSLLVAAFSLLILILPNALFSQEHSKKEEGKFNPGELIMEHISDDHYYHLFDWKGHPVSLPLPVIVYSPQKGVSTFLSSKFEHGHADYNGYRLQHNHVLAVNADGKVDESVKVYDFSLTKNVVQMLLALVVLVWIMISVASKYRKNGSTVAPSGLQNAIEPVITFIRDEVAIVNLRHKHKKYMPFLLTIFFFILINNIFGLVPGIANVTGNIAFTMVLAFISMLVILFSTTRHFWGHIFWPPGVPFLVKLILIPVEFAGIFIKPMALMIRLFANMVAGHIVITCFIMLIFIFGGMSNVAGLGFSPISILFTVFIYFIEILVAFIQAFIFTNLTAVFIGQAMEGDHGHEDADGHHDPVTI
ncbi:MAG: F0F1 ATP synthase subunit A [Chitinophagaceae bacterium]